MGTLTAEHFGKNTATKVLQKLDFVPVDNWPACYWHERLKLFLCVYVDDFKLSGPKHNLAEGWEFISKELDLDPPEEAGLYLGCIHERVRRWSRMHQPRGGVESTTS